MAFGLWNEDKEVLIHLSEDIIDTYRRSESLQPVKQIERLFEMHNTPGDLDILTRTVAGEARGESLTGKKAVVHVICNRVRSNKFKEHTLAQVCLKRRQFSCWNEEDRNFKYIVDLPVTSPVYLECLSAVAMALEEGDFTHGSTHYHTKNIFPKWSKGRTHVYQEGSHIFFNDIP